MKIGDEVYVKGVVDEIRRDTIIVHNDGGYFGTIAKMIEPVPVEPRRGKWIRTRTWEHDGEAYCSVCGYAPYDERDCHRICGHCGARMIQGEDFYFNCGNCENKRWNNDICRDCVTSHGKPNNWIGKI